MDVKSLTYKVDETHSVNLTSWIESANRPSTDFPPQNLPFCLFKSAGKNRIGVGIGDQVIDLAELAQAGLLPSGAKAAACGASLNALMGLSLDVRRELRSTLSRLVTVPESELAADLDLRRRCLHAQKDLNFEVPAHIGDYTDFYASVFHATNVVDVSARQSSASQLQTHPDRMTILIG